MKCNKFSIFLVLTHAFLYASSCAHAATNGTSNAGYGAFWFAFLIIYLTRKRAIGGWLLYYYFTLFANLFLLILIFGISFENFQPSGWDDRALYGLFIISVIPVYFLKGVEALIAFLLLAKRYRLQKFVNYLRYSLITQALVNGLTLLIDYNYFPDNVPMTVMGGFFAIIWYFYFSTSRRVLFVLSQKDWIWSYEVFQQNNSARKLAEAEAPKHDQKNFFGRIKNFMKSRKIHKGHRHSKTLGGCLIDLSLNGMSPVVVETSEKIKAKAVELKSISLGSRRISQTLNLLKLNKFLFITIVLLTGIFIIGFILFNKAYKLSVPDIAKKIGKSVVVIRCLNEKMEPLSQGSGFFIDEKGAIITNYHVVDQNSSYVEIITSNEKRYMVKDVLAKDEDADLLILLADIPRTEAKPIHISSSLPEPGEKIVVISNPLGLQHTVSEGIVSAIRPLEKIGDIIQITCPISHGSSGSPVVNLKGEVVGVVTFYFSEGQNLNFAVKSDRIMKMNPGAGVSLSQFFQENFKEKISQAYSYYKIAHSYAQQEQYERAIEYYTKSISRDKSMAYAYFERGYVYYKKLNDFISALDDYNMAIELRPTNYDFYLKRGLVYEELKNYRSAINDYDRAISLNPNDFVLYIRRGISYQALGDYIQNFKDYEMAIKLNPKEGYLVRGAAYGVLGYFEIGYNDLKEAARLGSLEAQEILRKKRISW